MASLWKYADRVFDFGVVNETNDIDFKFPLSTFNSTIQLEVVSGALPENCDIFNDHLSGVAEEVSKNKLYTFRIKATETVNSIVKSSEERTFTITIRANMWTEESGYKFPPIQEGVHANVDLPLNLKKDHSRTTFSIISGKLPEGCFLEGSTIVGIPVEVPRTTPYTFVVRGSLDGAVSDRTFTLDVVGADDPKWITPAGQLPIGNNSTFFVLDTTYVNFNLSAIDADTSAGQKLRYTVTSGSLPPGLTLSTDGQISGRLDPLFMIAKLKDNGNFDTSIYEGQNYDLSFRSSVGFDKWRYDLVTFDTQTTALLPTKLNRNYEFEVSVSDGESVITRRFKIYVVGEDHFRVDSEAYQLGEGVYTADSSYVKAPIWTTPADLGIKRAGNYHIFKLDTYEDPAATGPTVYSFNPVNPDTYGVSHSKHTGENKLGDKKIRLSSTKGAVPKPGFKVQLTNYVPKADYTVYSVESVQVVNNSEYVLNLSTELTTSIPDGTPMYCGSASVLPPGMQFDSGSGEILGSVPYQPAISKEYRFTITAIRLSDTDDTEYSERTFKVQMIGEIDHSLEWLTASDLGSIEAEMVSTLSIKAKSMLPNSVLVYSVVDGKLPPGLTLNGDGEIVGKVDQRQMSYHTLGITAFEPGFSLDRGATTIDKSYSFTVNARDTYGAVSDTKTFKIKVDLPNTKLYSNLVVRPFLKQAQRNAFAEFIKNANIFESQYIYRVNDPNFGIQQDLKMLVYAGIEMSSIDHIIENLGRNHKPKKFRLGDIKSAVAKQPGTNNIVYEVIYVEALDPLEVNGKHLPEMIQTFSSSRNLTVDSTRYNPKIVTLTSSPDLSAHDTIPADNDINTLYIFNETAYRWIQSADQTWQLTPDYIQDPWKTEIDPFLVTIDSSSVFAGDPGSSTRFPSSLSIWRDKIKKLGVTERNYLPLWMRSVQPGSVNELGYVPAIPLCYCKPGTSATILTNIKASVKSGLFDLKQIDYTVDRYIINRVTGYNYEKYIMFANNRTAV